MERLLETQAPSKPSVLDDIVNLLRRVLRWCVCCITCGCVPLPNHCLVEEEMRKISMHESDQRCILKLIRKFETVECEGVTLALSADDVHALEVMTFSNSRELQAVAGNCYQFASQRRGFVLTRDMVIPLINLLRSDNKRIYKPAVTAANNFLFFRSDRNRRLLVEGGVIGCLNDLTRVQDSDIQATAISGLVSISTSDAFKRQLVTDGTVARLLALLTSSRIKVQKNIVGALLNLTHNASLSESLVHEGVIPPMVSLLATPDTDLLYYVTATLCNLATTNRHRTMIMAVGYCDAVRYMIRCIAIPPEKVQCQACLTLRNFTSDHDNQQTVVKLGVLPALQIVIRKDAGRVLVPALALLQNISAYPANWDAIMEFDLHLALCDVVEDCSNSEAQQHAAVVLRNLASSDNLNVLVETGSVQSMGKAILDPLTNIRVLMEITAALAVAVRDEDARLQLIEIKNGGLFCKLVAMASISTHQELQYNAAGILGQMSLTDLPHDMKHSTAPGLFVYIDNFLKSPDPAFIHLALLTLAQLLKDYYFLRMFQRHHIQRVIAQVAQSSHSPEIVTLAKSILEELEKSRKGR